MTVTFNISRGDLGPSYTGWAANNEWHEDWLARWFAEVRTAWAGVFVREAACNARGGLCCLQTAV